jgi:hypothetical protein
MAVGTPHFAALVLSCFELLWLQGMQNLVVVKLHSCRQLQKVELSSCLGLRHVHIQWCDNLEAVQLGETTAGLEQQRHPQCGGARGALRELCVLHCGRLQGLDLRGAIALKDLDIRGCKQLHELRGLDELATFTCLRSEGCLSLPDLGLGALGALQRLATAWGVLEGLEGLSQSLSRLELTGSSRQELPSLTALTALKELSVRRWRELRKLDAGGLCALERLSVFDCDQLQVLALPGAAALQELSICGCHELADVGSLAGFSALTSLEVSGCPQLPVVDLSVLTALKRLRSSWAVEPEGLKGLRSLTRLELCGLQQDALPPLTSLAALRELAVLECHHVRRLQLWCPADLEYLVVGSCSELSALEVQPRGIRSSLQDIELLDCRKLKEVAGLEQRVALEAWLYGEGKPEGKDHRAKHDKKVGSLAAWRRCPACWQQRCGCNPGRKRRHDYSSCAGAWMAGGGNAILTRRAQTLHSPAP